MVKIKTNWDYCKNYKTQNKLSWAELNKKIIKLHGIYNIIPAGPALGF